MRRMAVGIALLPLSIAGIFIGYNVNVHKVVACSGNCPAWV